MFISKAKRSKDTKKATRTKKCNEKLKVEVKVKTVAKRKCSVVTKKHSTITTAKKKTPTLDENNNTFEHFRYYVTNFLDGYNYKITGKNLEFIKKEIVTNFFPEHKYENIFLVSSTVK